MVNNHDRIFAEIKREAERLTPDDMDSDALVDLAMEIVDLEDQHRVRPCNINQLVEGKIITSTNQTILRSL